MVSPLTGESRSGYTDGVSIWCIRGGGELVPAYKVNVSFPPELLEEIDETAHELGLTRSGFVAEASVRYVADVKNLTAEEQRQKDIERASKVFRRIGRQLPRDFDLMEQLRADRERDNAGE
jgi:hypothetical protein